MAESIERRFDYAFAEFAWAVFSELMLGHGAGKPHAEALRDAIVEVALAVFETMETLGSIAMTAASVPGAGAAMPY